MGPPDTGHQGPKPRVRLASCVSRPLHHYFPLTLIDTPTAAAYHCMSSARCGTTVIDIQNGQRHVTVSASGAVRNLVHQVSIVIPTKTSPQALNQGYGVIRLTARPLLAPRFPSSCNPAQVIQSGFPADSIVILKDKQSTISLPTRIWVASESPNPRIHVLAHP